MSSQPAKISRLQIYWQRFAPWLEATAITAWGLVLTKLWLSGQLFLLIHPNYIPLTVTAGILLLGIGAIEAWRVYKKLQYVNINSKSASQKHINLIKPSFGSGLLLFVAILGLTINPRPFASDKAIHRGVTDSLADARTIPQSFKSSNRPEERTLVEWVRTISAYPEPDAYVGQKVNLTGFVVHAPDQPDNMFLITRFVITCCAADVYPVSLPVKVTDSRANYPPDRWLKIEGQADVDNTDGKRQVVIVANNITTIPEPKNPYDY